MYRLLAIVLFMTNINLIQSQNCISVNTLLSNISLGPALFVPLPATQDTVVIPCNRSVSNVSIVLNYALGTEK